MRSGTKPPSSRRIGIAGTFVHHLGPFDWPAIFGAVGCEVNLSGESTYRTFQRGFAHASNDQCLPVKLFFGHLLEVGELVDAIFIPQYVSLRSGTYRCPKIIGLPLLAANTVPVSRPVLSVAIDANRPRATLWRMLLLLLRISWNPLRVLRALRLFRDALRVAACAPAAAALAPTRAGDRIGILAHEYTLQDRLFSFGLAQRIRRRGFDVVASRPNAGHAFDDRFFGCGALHWDFGQDLLTTAKEMLHDERVRGIVFVTFFGCGIDAFLEEILKRKVAAEKPYLCLSLDEHTGEAGVVTRIEAFLDMIKWRERSA